MQKQALFGFQGPSLHTAGHSFYPELEGTSTVSLHPGQGSPCPAQPLGNSQSPRKSDKSKDPPHSCSMERDSWRERGELGKGMAGAKDGFTAEISQFFPCSN